MKGNSASFGMEEWVALKDCNLNGTQVVRNLYFLLLPNITILFVEFPFSIIISEQFFFLLPLIAE